MSTPMRITHDVTSTLAAAYPSSMNKVYSSTANKWTHLHGIFRFSAYQYRDHLRPAHRCQREIHHKAELFQSAEPPTAIE
jgi:hypothetical protein